MADNKALLYEQMQKKTFTRWSNRYLAERKMAIKDLETDLCDGTKLNALLEIIGGEKIRPFNKRPRMKIQRIENLKACVDFVKARGVKLVGISAEDIEEGNLKLILGLMWSIILRFFISDGAGGTAAQTKKNLLSWINKQLKPYAADGVKKIKNFDKDWADGKALSALTDSLRPGCVDMKTLGDPETDVQNAMDVAEEEFDVCPIVDASDVVNQPDAHSMMTYLSYFRDAAEGDLDKKKKEEEARKKALEEARKKKEAAVARAKKWKAVGPGVEKGFRNRDLPFKLVPLEDGLEASPHEFEVVVKKDGKRLKNGEVHDTDDGNLEGSWKGQDNGEHEIEILLDGEPIAGTPYTVPLTEPSDASKSYAEGPGLTAARDDQPTHFTVYCVDKYGNKVKGEDALEVDMVYTDGKREAVEPKITDNGDGSYKVDYQAPRPGDLNINVMVANRGIKDMPFQIHVQSGDELDKLMSDIDKLRKKLGLPARQYTDDELNDPNLVQNLEDELKNLKDVQKLVDEIQDIRKKLGMDPREFSEDELIGPNAVPDRTAERDEMKDMLAQKQKVDPLVDKINKLRKKMKMSPRKFQDEELMGPNAVEDREQEVADLEEILPIHNDIHDLRKKLGMPKRVFEDDELDHFQNDSAIPDRIRERRALKEQLKNKNGTDPLVREIQKLRKGLGLDPKEFTEDELTGPTAVDDRTKERDDLKDVAAIVDDIQKLRKKLGLDPRDFTEDELTDPDAVDILTKDRDHLQNMVPLVKQIDDLRKKLDMDPRDYGEDDLVGPGTQDEREDERDKLLELLEKKRLVDPLVAEIQKLRKNLGLEEKKFTDDELQGDTAVEDRTEERDNLKAVTPLVKQIADLRKQLDMPERDDYAENELTGPTGVEQRDAVDERRAERDDLLDQLGTKQAVDPILEEINELRGQMELDPRDFDEDEKKDIKGRINERDHLQQMKELYDDINDLRDQLDLDKRDFDEDDLVGPGTIAERTKERDDLRARLDRKHQTDPLCAEIQKLHNELGLEPREFTEEEKTGPTAVKDRTSERDDLQQMTGIKEDIDDLRKELEMSPRDFDDMELSDPDESKRNDCLDDRAKERDELKEMVPIVEDIHDLRDKLELPKREPFEDYDLYGGTALDDRKDERDDLKDKLKRKNKTDPLIAEINKLRKKVYLDPKDYSEDEIMGENAVEDRTDERDQLREVVPLADEIRKLRKKLGMDPREYEEDELTGPTAVEDRTAERDELLDRLKTGRKINPLVAEIQRLRRRMDMDPREFTQDELYGPTAIEDRTAERDQLKEVTPLYNEINKLRRKLGMPVREFDDNELDGPDAVPDRTEERDDLLKKLRAKNQLEPLMRQIRKYRKMLDVPDRVFTDEELEDEDAVANLSEERDNLKEVVPLASEIQRLRKKLDMDPREFDEEELCGPDAVPDRTAERDQLRDMLAKKKELDPILKEIQKLRKKLGLPKREFEDDEIYGPTAYDDRVAERDQLRDMIPLVNDIGKFRKKLAVSPRDFDEDELTGEDALEDRQKERDDLEEIGPVCDEIQDLRKQLDMDPRDFEEDEIVGDDALQDRIDERDELADRLDRRRHLQPLVDELQRLRKELGMPLREFEEGELDADDADEMLLREIEDLKSKFNTRGDADKLAEEIQDLRKKLDMDPRDFTEEELDADDAVPKLTKERDDLKDELERRNLVGDLPEQIQKLRKILGYKPRKFPDVIPVEMVPELEEERDALEDECEERKERAKDLLDKIGKLWKYLKIPKSDRPDLSLGRNEVPSKKWLDKAEEELDRLRNMMKDELSDEVEKQQALLGKLWDQLHTPKDHQLAFYNGIDDLFTEEGIQAMRDEIQKLHTQLLCSKKIIKLILKRQAFIDKMLQFEVLASDPRRLFKDSRQLAKEEKFRQSAYPTLVNIEKSITDACTEFEERTGDGFMWEGEYYLVTLAREIENRGLDLELFGVHQGKKGGAALRKQKQKAAKNSKSSSSKKKKKGKGKGGKQKSRRR